MTKITTVAFFLAKKNFLDSVTSRSSSASGHAYGSLTHPPGPPSNLDRVRSVATDGQLRVSVSGHPVGGVWHDLGTKRTGINYDAAYWSTTRS